MIGRCHLVEIRMALVEEIKSLWGQILKSPMLKIPHSVTVYFPLPSGQDVAKTMSVYMPPCYSVRASGCGSFPP